MATKPNKIELFLYDVYFGDCFLMVFHYPGETVTKSVLIDFGSTGKGHGDQTDESDSETTGSRLLGVAKDIAARTNNSLDVVIATHRHKDHIYGFGLKDAGKIIFDMDPEIVIQPWTEDPEDNRDLSKVKSLLEPKEFRDGQRKNFVSMLHNMHDVAEAIESEALSLGSKSERGIPIDAKLRDRILFAADDNKNVAKIKNLKAVQNLQKMRGPHYVSFGYDKIDWASILPGVKVRILGPPLLEDYPNIAEATTTSDEFWSLLAMNKYFWGILAATSKSTAKGSSTPLFAAKHTLKGDRPANVRWFIRRLRDVRANQLLELVRFVDRALNNTSVIIGFEIGDQKLLFPGDAQIENWQYLLDSAKNDPALKKFLQSTTVYKVGHHGSRNATPRSLWRDFKNKATQKTKKSRLKTVISTMAGKHGESEDTMVPLPRMVDAMKAESNFFSSEEIKNGFVHCIEIPIKH